MKPNEFLDNDDEPKNEGIVDTVKGAVRKVKRGNEAHKKGWQEFGKIYQAGEDDAAAERSVRNSNRYFNLTNPTGVVGRALGKNSHTKGGFPRSVRQDTPMDEAANDYDNVHGKPYGVRYKMFAGKEQRITTKEKFFSTDAQLKKFCQRLESADGFYEIDGFSYPQEKQVAEDQVNELSPATKSRYVSKAAYDQDRKTYASKHTDNPAEKAKLANQAKHRAKGVERALTDDINETTEAQKTRLAALRELGQEMIKANKAFVSAVAKGDVDKAEKIKSYLAKVASKKLELGESESDTAPTATKWTMSIEGGPTAADCKRVEFTASSEEEARAKGERWIKKNASKYGLRNPSMTDVQPASSKVDEDKGSKTIPKPITPAAKEYYKKHQWVLNGNVSGACADMAAKIKELNQTSVDEAMTWGEKIANKIMGAAPEEPKYKVGQVVQYQTDPYQPDWDDYGSGTGRIDSYSNGHYMINGHPVNHHEIKKVVSEDGSAGASCSASIAAGPAGSLFTPVKRKKKVKEDEKMPARRALDISVDDCIPTIKIEYADWITFPPSKKKEIRITYPGKFKIINKPVKEENPMIKRSAMGEGINSAATTKIGALSQFRPPFKSNGLWVDDSRGSSVLECVNPNIAKEVAVALNTYTGAKK